MSLTTRFDNLINQYKGVFIDKARGIGATTYGINKTYEIASKNDNTNTLIVCCNEQMVKHVHCELLFNYKISKSSSRSYILLTLDNDSKIYIVNYSQLKYFTEYQRILFDFIFMDEPNKNYSVNHRLEEQICNRYKTQMFAIGSGYYTPDYSTLMSRTPLSQAITIPWYEVEDKAYLKKIDDVLKYMPTEIFDYEFRCK